MINEEISTQGRKNSEDPAAMKGICLVSIKEGFVS